MKRRSVLGVMGCTVLMGLSLTACSEFTRTKYKMTVEVETPEGDISGFAVREITRRVSKSSMPLLGEDRGSVKVRGEAVAVDLPDGKVLFALLSSSKGDQNYAVRDVSRILKHVKQNEIELWPTRPEADGLYVTDTVPMLVTFTDIKDPTSVQKVEADDLSASFGEGYALKSITIEITDEPVTTGIEKRLGWLGNLEKYRSDPKNPFTNTLPPEISALRSN